MNLDGRFITINVQGLEKLEKNRKMVENGDSCWGCSSCPLSRLNSTTHSACGSKNSPMIMIHSWNNKRVISIFDEIIDYFRDKLGISVIKF